MRTQVDDKVLEFLQDIVEVYRKHGMSLANDDGAFMVQPLLRENITWLLGAKIELDEQSSGTKQRLVEG